jgi:hypothetical protein
MSATTNGAPDSSGLSFIHPLLIGIPQSDYRSFPSEKA